MLGSVLDPRVQWRAGLARELQSPPPKVFLEPEEGRTFLRGPGSWSRTQSGAADSETQQNVLAATLSRTPTMCMYFVSFIVLKACVRGIAYLSWRRELKLREFTQVGGSRARI